MRRTEEIIFSKIKEEQKVKKKKKEKKVKEVQKRAVILAKDFLQTLKLIESQNASATLTFRKQQELEQDKRLDISRREKEFTERKKQLEDWRIQRENEEKESLECQMDII